MTTSTAPITPFKGLSPFADTDADAFLFFGRGRETEMIAANLQAARVTILFGPTGVGKTSVLRAGVAQRLRRERNTRVEIVDTWSGDFESVVRSAIAPRGDEDLYVILDQFEEYFNYSRDENSFAALLAEVVLDPGSRVNVLIGIREDALARLDVFKPRIPMLLANRLRLERLGRRAAAEAINGPVEVYNRTRGPDEAMAVETAFVDAVLDEVAVGRVQLGTGGRGAATNGAASDRIEAPYLQLVLERLWEAEVAQRSRTLRLSTLRDLGGAATIVRDHLDRAMAALTPDEQRAAAAMYRHLVTPSGTKIAHDVADLAGYAEVERGEAAVVLGKLARERIVRGSSDNGASAARYEIYHDVLADAVLGWRARYEQERQLERAHAERRRARIVAAAALAGLLVVGAVAVYALVERGRARTQARNAHAQQFAAEAITRLDSDPSGSVALALAAARLQPRLQEEEVLRAALTRDRQRAVLRANGPVAVAAFDVSGQRVLAAGSDGAARVYDRRGRLLATYHHGAPLAAAVFAPGDIVVTGGRDGRVRIWHSGRTPAATLAAGGPVRMLAADRSRIVAATVNGNVATWTLDGGFRRLRLLRTHLHVVDGAVSPDGRFVVLTSHDRFARVYRIASGRRVATLAQRGYIGNVEFRHDGGLLLTSGNEGTVRLWRVRGWKRVRELRGPGSAVEEATFSRDGRLVAAASDDGTVRVWEAASGFQRAVMIGHTNAAVSVAFNPTASAVVSTSTDGTARVWDIGGRPTSVLAGHHEPVLDASYSPDGATVVTAGEDGTARLWDPASEPELRRVSAKRVVDLAPTADGTRFVTAGAGFVLWSTSPIRPIRRLSSEPTSLAALSPDGTRAAAALAREPVVLVVDARGRARLRLRGPRPATALAIDRDHRVFAAAGPSVVIVEGRRLRSVHEATAVDDLAASPDGRLIATAGADGAVRLRDARTWQLRAVLRAHTDAVESVDFTADGKTLVTAGRDHEVRMWDVQSGRLERRLRWHFGPVADAAVSPDGRWLVTAGPGTAGIGLAREGELFRPGAYLRGPTRPLTAVAFVGHDGRTVIAAAKDGSLRAYTCDLCGGVNALVELARRRLAGAG